MKKTYIHKVVVFLFTIQLFFSCELDRLPTNAVVDENFWKSEQDFQLACNAFYMNLPGYSSRDLYSDISYNGSPNEYSSGTYLPTNSFGPWNSAYTQIATANKVIQNALENKFSVDEAIVNRYEGEARFYRAWQYFDLLRSYGGVPIVEKLLDIDSKELYAPRNTREEVVTFILKDLDLAIKYLPMPSALKSGEIGRFTRTAALTLKSRVALYEGTRQKYREKGEYKDFLQQAADAAHEVIKSGEHALYRSSKNDPVLNFQECFIYEGEGSKETILANRYQSPWRKHSNSQSLLRGPAGPTRAIVDAFLCADGLPIEVSQQFKGYVTPGSEFENRDARMRATLLVPFEDIAWDGKPYEAKFANGTSQTGYTWKKMAVNEDALALESDLDAILIRYAETLLNYAEAKYELADHISNEDLDISVNELRRRVGMVALTNEFIQGANPGNVKLDMRDEIRRERLVELANEGFRYDDLLRWGIAQDVLPKALVGIPDLREYYKYVNNNVWKKVKNGFVELQPTTDRTFEEKHYLWPLPLVQLALNENLEQNPDW